MNLETWAKLAGIAVAAATLLGAVVTFWPRWTRFWARLNGTFDAVVGREAYTDAASGKEVEALLPLTTRVAHVEEAVIEFRHMVGVTTEALKRIDLVEHRVKALEDARVERLVSQAESAHMWRAVADHDADVTDAED